MCIRDSFITVLSLFLGITISLGAVVLSKGTDQTNRINYENADFSIISHMTAMQVESYSDQDVFLKDDLKEKVENLPGIKEEEVVHGGYGRVFTDEEALAPRIATWGYEDKTSITFVVQALSDDILHQIKMCIRDRMSMLPTTRSLPMPLRRRTQPLREEG